MPTQEELDKVTAERDAALNQVKTLEASVTTKVEEAVKANDSKLGDRVIIRTQAVQVDSTKDKTITKLAMDSKTSDREVMVAVIQAKDPEFKADGRSDEYIRCRFDLTVQDKGEVRADSAAKQAEDSKLVALAGGQTRNDGGDIITQARNKMVETNKGLALGKVK
jgi:hypothetical protein